ncbi:MAG TPA: NUDIX domain-containing protein, partial [Pyrinomonadaceae bacterium]|nr:NUDIX domain-containing protein [Pyrinomonadaceae bacterium]
MAAEQIILVDGHDQEVGVGDKLQTHIEGALHRAFSIFIFDAKRRLLLQKRAKTKYHSGGLWSNTCCGHPRPGESTEAAAHRRLKHEMS